jgi:hypothetical protein
LHRRFLVRGGLYDNLVHRNPEAAMTLTLDVELPADLDRFRLPETVHARLQSLLDRRDDGQPLDPEERAEAEGLVDLAEFR